MVKFILPFGTKTYMQQINFVWM